MIKNDQGFVIELPEEVIQQVHGELIEMIYNPGQVKLCRSVLKRSHKNYFYFKHGLPIEFDYLDLLYVRFWGELTEEQIALVDALDARITAPKPQAQTNHRAGETAPTTHIIREMLRGGLERAEVAKQLGIKYQRVYQVWKSMQ